VGWFELVCVLMFGGARFFVVLRYVCMFVSVCVLNLFVGFSCFVCVCVGVYQSWCAVSHEVRRRGQ